MPVLRNAALANPVTTALNATGSGTRYDVGPGHPFAECDNVPWATLGPGDVVNIHHRAAPYITKFGLRAEGTAANQVIVNGVTDSAGNRPVISGAGATTAAGSQAGAGSVFGSNYVHGELLGVIVIKARPSPPGIYSTEWPQHLTVQNLEIQGALNTDTWTDLAGVSHNYAASAGIYVLHGRGITLRNNKIHDCGFGIFTQEAKDTTGNWVVQDITITENQVYDNGVSGSYFEHNLYVQAIRPVVTGNYIGQVRAGSPGASYKSRSAGEVFAYNTVVSSARAVDFVHAEGQPGPIDQDGQYGETWCYGNLLVNDLIGTGRGAAVPIHFGCDQSMEDGPIGTPLITDADLAPGQDGPGTGPQRYAKRNLFFFKNTVVNRANLADAWRVHVFDLSLTGTPLSPTTTLWEWDNAYHFEGTSNFMWLEFAGQLNHMGGSRVYSPSAISAARDNADSAKYQINGTPPTGSAPLGFSSVANMDFMPLTGTPLDNAGIVLPAGLPQTWVPRSVNAMPNGIGGGGLVPRPAVTDVGAFDNTAGPTPNTTPVLVTPLVDQVGTVGTAFNYTFPLGAFTDAEDGTDLTYLVSALPDGIYFSGIHRQFSGTPTTPGTTVVTVTARDLSYDSVQDTFTITVNTTTPPPPPPGANMPVIIQKGDLSPTSFSNNNTNNAGGIAVRTDSSSAVGQAISAAIAALPPEKYVTAGSYNATTDTLTLTLSDNVVVNIPLNGLIQDTLAGVPTATDTLAGKVALATSANYPQPTNDLDAATPAYVQAALDALDCTTIVDALNQTPDTCSDASRGAMLFTSSAAPDILSGDGGATLTNPWTVGNLTFGGGGMQSPAPTPDGELRQLLQVATRVGPQVNSWLTAWAANPADMMVGNITYNVNGAITTASVVWPDGATGTYTATDLSTAFPGATDAYTVTYVGIGAQQGVNQIVTQPLVTRDAAGRITTRPARTVAVFNPAAGG